MLWKDIYSDNHSMIARFVSLLYKTSPTNNNHLIVALSSYRMGLL